MGQIDLGRVQGHSIAKISRVSSSGNIDTYEVKLDDNTSAGQFTVTNGIDGTNGLNGKDGKDGAPGTVPNSFTSYLVILLSNFWGP